MSESVSLTVDQPVQPRSWRAQALCRDADPELWFPAAQPPSALWEAQVREASQVCGWCPVRKECLQWALASAQTDGVWGGLPFDVLSKAQRRNLSREW